MGAAHEPGGGPRSVAGAGGVPGGRNPSPRRRERTNFQTMGHILDGCDISDVLEESARLGRRLIVELKGGHRFVDRARELVAENREEWVVFRDHDRVRVADISFCGPADPPEPSYRGKT